MILRLIKADSDNPHKRFAKTLTQVVFWLLLGGTFAIANADWRKQSPVPGPGGQVVATSVTPDGSRAATVTEDGHISLWDIPNRTLIRSIHLPEGKPHHLAIRDQGDAVAVAYEDANAVIWWCDESDKLVRPDVQARLVAFAHQKRLLAVAGTNGVGSTWDINAGTVVIERQIGRQRIDGPFFGVLPNDDGAITYNNGLLGAVGFMLESDAEIHAGGSGIMAHSSDEPTLWSGSKFIGVHYHQALGTTFTAYTQFGHNPTTLYSKGNFTMPAVCSVLNPPKQTQQGGMISLHFGGALTPAYNFAAISKGPEQARAILTGNTTGDLVIHRRVQPSDWLYHPTAWLLTAFGIAFIVQIITAIVRFAGQDKATPKFPDAMRSLPATTRIAAWIAILLGILSIAGMTLELLSGSFTLNFAALLIPAGVALLRSRSNGWRRCCVFFMWGLFAAGALILGSAWLGGQMLELRMSGNTIYAPQWLGVSLGILISFVGTFGWHALTDPRAKRICAAATHARKFGTIEYRRLALMTCKDCGYDTRRTVADGMRRCPECGRQLFHDEVDQAWMAEQLTEHEA